MAFDITKLEIDKIVVYNEIEYRVIDISSSGLLFVAKEEDIKNENYPLAILAIPDDCNNN